MYYLDKRNSLFIAAMEAQWQHRLKCDFWLILSSQHLQSKAVQYCLLLCWLSLAVKDKKLNQILWGTQVLPELLCVLVPDPAKAVKERKTVFSINTIL